MDVRAGIAAGDRVAVRLDRSAAAGEDLVRQLVVEAHERYRTNSDGALSEVYPALARVPAGSSAICVAGIGGNLHAAGDVEVE